MMQPQIIARIKIPITFVRNPSQNSNVIAARTFRCIIIIIVLVTQFQISTGNPTMVVSVSKIFCSAVDAAVDAAVVVAVVAQFAPNTNTPAVSRRTIVDQYPQ